MLAMFHMFIAGRVCSAAAATAWPWGRCGKGVRGNVVGACGRQASSGWTRERLRRMLEMFHIHIAGRVCNAAAATA